MSEEKKEPVDLTRLDKDQVEKRKLNLARVRRYREKKDIKEVLSTPAGRRVWYRMLDECGAFRSAFCGEAPFTAHFNMGKTDIGLWAMKEMDEARPETYTEMQREHKSDVIFSDKLDKEAESEMKE